jgi:hypothetical protein
MSFKKIQTRASTRITSLINSKLDDFFGLSEYDWTPATREDAPSMYLYELVNWLTTVVDSLQISESYKDEAYRAATAYIAQCLMVRSFLTISPPPREGERETKTDGHGYRTFSQIEPSRR